MIVILSGSSTEIIIQRKSLMIEQRLQPYTTKYFLEPLSDVFLKCFSRTPNIYTLSASVFGVIAVSLIYFKLIYLGILAFLISGCMDMLDGYIARIISRTSDLGAVLDIVSDRFVEFCFILAIYLVIPKSEAIYCIVMLGSILLCVTSFLVVGIFSENEGNKGFYYSPGLIERPEAFIFFISMLILPQYIQIIASIFSVLVALTTLIRMWQFRGFCKN